MNACNSCGAIVHDEAFFETHEGLCPECDGDRLPPMDVAAYVDMRHPTAPPDARSELIEEYRAACIGATP